MVKPYWRKGLRNTAKVGPPPEGDEIWARVPEQKFNKTYINLKKGNPNYYKSSQLGQMLGHLGQMPKLKIINLPHHLK